jgi:glyceraldehyde 3-phosphate dehydrogenase
MTRVAINGFGRVGRLALRAGWDRDDLEFVHINEPNGGPEAAAHLLIFDSVHGRWECGAQAGPDSLMLDSTPLRFTEALDPGAVAWEESGARGCSSARDGFAPSSSCARTSTTGFAR